LINNKIYFILCRVIILSKPIKSPLSVKRTKTEFKGLGIVDWIEELQNNNYNPYNNDHTNQEKLVELKNSKEIDGTCELVFRTVIFFLLLMD
jgi:hypothetical protein